MAMRKKKHSLTTTERQSEEAGGDNYVGKDFFSPLKYFTGTFSLQLLHWFWYSNWICIGGPLPLQLHHLNETTGCYTNPIRNEEFCAAVQLHMAPFEDYLHSDTIANVALLQRSRDLLTD